MAESIKRQGLWPFWLILIIGAGPMLVAWYLYQHPEWLGEPANQGNLIQPPVPIERQVLEPISGIASRPLEELRGRWVIIHPVADDCDPACRQVLQNTHKLRLLFNKDMPRVRRLLIVSKQSTLSLEQLKVLAQKDLYLARASDEFLNSLARDIQKSALANGQVWLMDPLGNLMMWYDSGFDPYGLYHDLKRLLKVSRLG